MEFILSDINKGITDAFEEIFKDEEGFSVYHGYIFDTNPDLLVSPANSFGFMSGGIDGVYTKVMGNPAKVLGRV